MPRYVVERTFPGGLRPTSGADGGELCQAVVERNTDDGVTWIHSYVSDDREKTFCVYDAPSPEAIRKTAARNDLPVDRITQVFVLDPYFYRSEDVMPARLISFAALPLVFPSRSPGTRSPTVVGDPTPRRHRARPRGTTISSALSTTATGRSPLCKTQPM